VRRREEQPRVAGLCVREAAGTHDGRVIVDPKESVHGRVVPSEGLTVVNDQAAKHEDLDVRLLLFQLGVVGDDVAGLSARGVDEPARVDEHDVGLVGRRSDESTRRRKTRKQSLGIDEVLRASEARKVDADEWRRAYAGRYHCTHHTALLTTLPHPRRTPVGLSLVSVVDYSIMEYRGTRGLPADYAILGLLLDGPAHGYDVQQRLHAGLGAVWRIAWSQLYSVLHSLEERKWVRATTRESPSGPPRHTYAITARGQRAFFEWAVAPVPRLRDVRIEFLAKLYFLRQHRPEELESLLERQAKALEQAIAELNESGGDPWMTSIAAAFRRHQTESALAWIDEVRRSLKKEGKDKR
jgi:PadR family transcriptional regulator, regulatory protein AphA